MTPVTILREAEAEIKEAVEFYEDKRPGLGLDFSREVEASIQSVRHFPKRWPIRNDGTRRYLLHRFPYIVVYLLLNDHIWIIALAHCKRRPGYWSVRIGSE
ncbi:MAG TPA: type II toxin-antitoxin system RelE/ParE family toxin [Verrucomicrobiae bacterium]|nr:type II toxin-antitoxin system RelE/ParE family toxin [Verrucomicrobiae bacterium]